jgi:hypothetical protein
LWPAELLAKAFRQGDPLDYESLWQPGYRRGLMAASAILYAGTSSGVLKSTDGGGNWSPLNTGLTNLWIDALVIDPATPFTLYVGTKAAGAFDMHELLYRAYLPLIGRAQQDLGSPSAGSSDRVYCLH